MLTITTLLALIALVLTLINGLTGKVPLWVAVLFVCLAMLVGPYIIR
jgi:hypothetical protein